MTEREYGKLVKQMSPNSPIGKDCLNAFWIGGLICVLGQALMNWYTSMGLSKTDAGTAASMSLVVLSALLTGLSLYDNIAKYAGAGTLVPITGFANSIAAPAVEFRTEGFVLGVAAKMFQIPGDCLRHRRQRGVWGHLLDLDALCQVAARKQDGISVPLPKKQPAFLKQAVGLFTEDFLKERGSVIVARSGFGEGNVHMEHMTDGFIVLGAVALPLCPDSSGPKQVILGLAFPRRKSWQAVVMKAGG